MVTVSPLALHTPTRVKWTALQEKSISREYPFTDLADESPDQFVVRTYLQFLWLPESIMPLTLLIPSIRRVSSSRHPSELEHENTHAHALHTLIQPLLLSVRTSASKYHTELPQILADNGGAGELEETMMWFALNYEKSSEDEDEERWRNQWLERLERREVQIQILLYFLKLSLPGPQTPLPPVTIPAPATTTSFPTSTSTHSRKRKSKPKIVIPSTTERLESFMDKLSTWQLLSSMDAGAPTSPGNRSGDRELERDWMQAFCEDVVEPQFKTSLPDMCALLRNKLFPHSPFPDNPPDSDSQKPHAQRSKPRPSHAQILEPQTSKTSTSRRPSPATATAADAQARARSRSLSVSLAQDQAQDGDRRTSTSTIKRAFSREISMSRGFRGAKGKQDAGKAALGETAAETQGAEKGKRGAGGEKEREKEKAGSGRATKLAASKSMGAVTLVAATPTKPRTLGRSKSSRAGSSRAASPSPSFMGASQAGQGSMDASGQSFVGASGRSSSPVDVDTEDDDFEVGGGGFEVDGYSYGAGGFGRSSSEGEFGRSSSGGEFGVGSSGGDFGQGSSEGGDGDVFVEEGKEEAEEEEIWLPSSSPDVLLLGISPLRPSRSLKRAASGSLGDGGGGGGGKKRSRVG